MLDRRDFLTLLTLAPLLRCASRSEAAPESGWRNGRIGARPLDAKEGAAPLVVLLHGATGRGERARRILEPYVGSDGIVLVAPDSAGVTWDGIEGNLGPDVERIDALLEETFAEHVIDPTRIAIAGFSDGASYALTLGLANGDLFTHTIAFSPGILAVSAIAGHSRFFLSHGRQDEVLPVLCSRTIVPRLTAAGYSVQYREFDGGHRVPPEIAGEAMKWFLHA